MEIAAKVVQKDRGYKVWIENTEITNSLGSVRHTP